MVRGGQSMRLEKIVKSVTSRLAFVGAVKLSGWAPRDIRKRQLKTLGDKSRWRCCVWKLSSTEICNDIDLPEEVDYPRTPFSLRFTLVLNICSVTFVWLRLIYCTPHLHVSSRAILSENSRLRIASTTWLWSKLWFAVVCNLAYFRICATSMPRYIQYISPLRLLAHIFSILSPEGISQSRYRSQKEETFWVALPTSKIPQFTHMSSNFNIRHSFVCWGR